jgi:DNA modification methylase
MATGDMRVLSADFVQGDCRWLLPRYPAEHFSSVVTDPPYNLGFMGKEWDKSGVAFQPRTWRAIARVVQPGGYLLAFGGTRTFHRMACAIEDAGWELKDTLCWLYGSGFPKGEGSLKPAWEPVLLCRKPGPMVLPLNIDACRVPAADAAWGRLDRQMAKTDFVSASTYAKRIDQPRCGSAAGRYPANVVLDDSAEVQEAFAAFGNKRSAYPGNRTSADAYAGTHIGVKNDVYQPGVGITAGQSYTDTGTAARYFMCCPADTTTEVENCEYLWHHEATDSAQELNPCCKNACLAVANSMLAPMTFSEGSADSVVETADADTCENEAKRTPGGRRQKTVDGIATGEKRGAGKSIGKSRAGGSGKWPMGQSPTATTFTTGTETTRTTTCPTCNCSLVLSITPCTSESGKTIGYSLTVRKLGDVNCATSTSPLVSSSNEKPALFRATAKPVSGKNSDSGGNGTERSTTPTCESIASVNSARFFYCAKARSEERVDYNTHPTVKPLALMRWLCRLVTPVGGIVLDPFCGSGSTVLAATLEGFSAVGMDMDPESVAIAARRLADLPNLVD